MQPSRLPMFLCLVLLPACLTVPAGAAIARAAESRTRMSLAEILDSKMSCEECHRETTPRVYQEHQASAHAKNDVGCADCHGADHTKMPPVTARSVCQKCHDREAAEFLASAHGRSWESMRTSARYQKQPEVVREQGCEACHRIGLAENDGRCDFCHTKHRFAKAEAAAPSACYTCHMGPDHPQMEAYRQSRHHFTPATCVSCHLPGTHDVSRNLARLSGEYLGKECGKCHDQAFNRQWMDGAAMLEDQGKQLLAAARRIIARLDEQGLLFPAPTTREPNPVEGRKLVLGGHQLYEDTSRAEKIYFEMVKYLQVHLVQGAYHQDFKMAAYQGLIPLQKHLAELQAEALFLEEIAAGKKPLSPIGLPQVAPLPGPLYHATYESSFHGVLPETRQKPVCATCHPPNPAPRVTWTETCGACHTAAQSSAFTQGLEAMRKHARSLRQEAETIIAGLVSQNILHRTQAGALQLAADFGENRQSAEVLRQRLAQYLADLDQSLDMMVLGVAHSNPDYAHWYGNAPAKSDLIEIRDAANKLKLLLD